MSGYIEHEAGINERWDALAYRYYGDANRTAPLIAANRHLFLPTLSVVPSIFEPGTVIRVPLLAPDETASDLLPPWKRGVG